MVNTDYTFPRSHKDTGALLPIHHIIPDVLMMKTLRKEENFVKEIFRRQMRGADC